MSEFFVDLDAVFNLAVQETEELVKHGIDVSDPCVVTSLGWYANKYQEIAERCNSALLELIDKQAADFPRQVIVPSEIDMDGF
ncbi:amino acid adenylation protein [Scytonema sp. NUACC26]|uniref:amino acid adenylation protein n=1 Tax=Scytonema sp. NUACC26 TaxID=3140176 RepID=UPI0034DC2734